MKLIDADKLHYIKVIILHQTKEEATEKQDVVVFAKEIDKAPIVDAVPVVRCKDCLYRLENNHLCPQLGTYVEDTFFCADGERKEGEKDDKG